MPKNLSEGLTRRELLELFGVAGVGATEFFVRLSRVLDQAATATPTPTLCEPTTEATAEATTEATAEATYNPDIDLVNRYPLQEVQALPGNYTFVAQLVSIEVGKKLVANGALEVHILGLCKLKNESKEFITIALPLGVNAPQEDGTNNTYIAGFGPYLNSTPFEDLAFENASKQLKIKSGDIIGVIFSDSADVVGPDSGIVFDRTLEQLITEGQLDDFRQTGATDKLPTITFNGKCYPFLLPREITQTNLN